MTSEDLLRSRTRVLLLEIRFPAHHCGFRQLCEAIPLYAQDPELSMTKELYPKLTALFGRDAESNMRRAILHAWHHGSKTAWEKYFPHQEKAPSNLPFIATAAQIIQSDLQTVL